MAMAWAMPMRAIFSASASARARICAACCSERWYSALPWLLWMVMLSSDSVSMLLLRARASASRSSRSLTAAFSWRP